MNVRLHFLQGNKSFVTLLPTDKNLQNTSLSGTILKVLLTETYLTVNINTSGPLKYGFSFCFLFLPVFSCL